MSLTTVLSGPLASRAPLLSALQRAGANMGEQPDRNPNHGLPTDPETGWVTAIVDDLDIARRVLERSDRWALRLHWNTPACLACSGHGVGQGGSTCLHCLGAGATNKPYRPPDRLAELEARVAGLEGRP
jgi:hypothetical protein